jgi:hypothetical protein
MDTMASNLEMLFTAVQEGHMGVAEDYDVILNIGIQGVRAEDSISLH